MILPLIWRSDYLHITVHYTDAEPPPFMSDPIYEFSSDLDNFRTPKGRGYPTSRSLKTLDTI